MAYLKIYPHPEKGVDFFTANLGRLLISLFVTFWVV